jgi:hypothetical protein
MILTEARCRMQPALNAGRRANCFTGAHKRATSSQSGPCQYIDGFGAAYTTPKTDHDELEAVLRGRGIASLPALSFFKSASSGSTPWSASSRASLVRHMLSLQYGGTCQPVTRLPQKKTASRLEYLQPALLDAYAAAMSPTRLNLFRRWILKSFVHQRTTDQLYRRWFEARSLL